MCTLKKRGLEREEQKEVCHSRYWCPDCDKGFCPDDYFKEWHLADKLEGRDFGPKRVRRKRWSTLLYRLSHLLLACFRVYLS